MDNWSMKQNKSQEPYTSIKTHACVDTVCIKIHEGRKYSSKCCWDKYLIQKNI